MKAPIILVLAAQDNYPDAAAIKNVFMKMEAPRYRTATVREWVPLFFNHEPTSSSVRKGDEDAE